MAVPTHALLSLLAQKQQADQYTTEQMQQGAQAITAPPMPTVPRAAEARPTVTPPVTDWQQHDMLGAKRAIGLEQQDREHTNQKDLLEFRAKLQQRMRGKGGSPAAALMDKILRKSEEVPETEQQRQQRDKMIGVWTEQLRRLPGGSGQVQLLDRFGVTKPLPQGGERFSQKQAMETIKTEREEGKQKVINARELGKLEARVEQSEADRKVRADSALLRAATSPGAMMADLGSNPAAQRLQAMAAAQGQTLPQPAARPTVQDVSRDGSKVRLTDGTVLPIEQARQQGLL